MMEGFEIPSHDPEILDLAEGFGVRVREALSMAPGGEADLYDNDPFTDAIRRGRAARLNK